ncbi:MAG: hypothetical protein P9M15_04085, partial [Candidatus Electryoneaceae bacterium]|nr:hypothetical protein [Candidatus Electryoneaceae bacterium]
MNAGKYQLWRAYDGFEGGYMNFMDWNNLMGDPGTHIWTGEPREINVEHIGTMALGGSRVMVTVSDEENDTPEADALVCLYKNDDDYHEVCYTNDDGIAEFRIAPDQLSSGDLLVTVTKHNVLPYLDEIEVAEMEYYLGVEGWTIDDGDDEEANPGELVDLITSITNFGTDTPDGAVIATIESLSRWATVDNDPVEWDEAPGPGESVEATFTVEFDPFCPDQETILLPVDVTVGETVWHSMISIDLQSPEITIRELSFGGGDFDPGDVSELDIQIRNTGHQLLDGVSATLWSESEVVRVLQSESSYNAININSSRYCTGDPFRISAHPLTIPGMTVWLGMAVETEAGFIDTARVQITVGEPDQEDPFGPDEYGYICFDSGDEGWEIAPVYDWVEINPEVDDNDFDGTELDLRDAGDNQDESVVVDLPFGFQYYGEVFDEITVCTNGWAALGNQNELSDFRNRRIAQPVGPDAHLCVWWDNLITVGNSAILTHYDEEGGRFIIEWSQMRRLVEWGQGADETFQIILYEIEQYPTFTGDGVIVYQYEDVENERVQAHNDTPYCTIGIGNLNDTDGLQYTYWNSYPAGAMPIESEMAITFITSAVMITGVLEGTITDAETGDPIANAEVLTTRGFWSETDENGFYCIDNIIIGDGYEVTAYSLGWNDSTRGMFEIIEEETLTVDFELLHPEFASSDDQFTSRLMPGESQDFEFNLTNDGNGQLTWSVERALRGNINADPWEHRQVLMIGDTVDDSRVEGVIFIDDRYYVTGGGSGDRDDNNVYIFDRDGRLLNQYEQFGESAYGMKDLAWDGDLIWGSGERNVFGFTLDGELRTTFEGPCNPNTALAWDPDRNLLWMSSITTDIVGVDLEGNEQEELDRCDLRIYGLAYWQEDPDGHPLYIFTNINSQQYVYKMNPENGDTMFVSYLEQNVEGVPRAGGAFITNQFDCYSWVFIDVISMAVNRGGDRIDVW